jgi:hypothetical protein
MLAPLLRFAPDMTRKELTDFVGEKMAQAALASCRHCEERSDEAIEPSQPRWISSLRPQ